MAEVSGRLLLDLARRAIEASFEGRQIHVPPESWLQAPAAAFVSLHERAGGDLRGCIGTIEARQPLGDAIVTAALGAAFRDTRFAPLERSELALVRLEISVLSPLEPLAVASEAEAVAVIGRTRPGVVLQAGWRRSVLLPKVWESVADAALFLQHLKLKAGLPPSYWASSVSLAVFTCDEFAEA
jgi:AmmeMemoRadiSam system protein A